jgi:hypothetical protein
VPKHHALHASTYAQGHADASRTGRAHTGAEPRTRRIACRERQRGHTEADRAQPELKAACHRHAAPSSRPRRGRHAAAAPGRGRARRGGRDRARRGHAGRRAAPPRRAAGTGVGHRGCAGAPWPRRGARRGKRTRRACRARREGEGRAGEGRRERHGRRGRATRHGGRGRARAVREEGAGAAGSRRAGGTPREGGHGRARASEAELRRCRSRGPRGARHGHAMAGRAEAGMRGAGTGGPGPPRAATGERHCREPRATAAGTEATPS